MSAAAQKLEEIANEVLGIPTLESRNMDSDDFHELAVWVLKDALERAYEAGQQGD